MINKGYVLHTVVEQSFGNTLNLGSASEPANRFKMEREPRMRRVRFGKAKTKPPLRKGEGVLSSEVRDTN